MTNRLLYYLTIILFLIPFTLLIVDNKVLFPFITTKAIIFRILVSLGLFIAIWIYLLNPGTFPKKNFLFLSIILFLVFNIISTIFSINPYRSFWGNAERMEGLWSLFFYLTYFFLLFTLFQFSPKSKKIIFYSFLIVTTLISLIEINQAFFKNLERPSATLGNATYIGFMNLLTIFLLLYFYLETNSPYEKLTYLGLGIINLVSLLASQTRGSILGLLLGIFSFIFFYLLFSKMESKKKIYFFVFAFIFLTTFFFFLKTDLALLIPGIKRIAETLQDPVSVFPRLYAWKIFFNAFLEKPIFGWGQETMPIAFFMNFDPRIFNYEQAIFDRPHNKFIEVLASTGIVGFLSWLLIFISFFYYLFKFFKEKPLILASLFGFIFAYFGQSLSLFDMQASYLLLFFGLSLIAPKVEIKESRERFIRPYLILSAGVVLIFLILHLQHYYIVSKIITYLREQNIEKSSYGFLRISEIAGPFLTEEAIMASNHLISNIEKIKNFDIFLNFNDVIKAAYIKEPLDYRLSNVYLRQLYFIIQIKGQIGQDSSKEIKEVKNIYESLIKIYPNLPEIYINYAKFLFDLGESSYAENILKKGEKFGEIYPKYYIYSAQIYFNRNEIGKAYENLKKALENKIVFKSDSDLELALRIFVQVGDKENTQRIISLWKTQNPSTSTIEKIRKIIGE